MRIISFPFLLTDGKHLIAGDEAGTIHVFQVLKSGSQLKICQHCKGHQGSIKSLDWSSDGKYLRSSSLLGEYNVCELDLSPSTSTQTAFPFTGENTQAMNDTTWSICVARILSYLNGTTWSISVARILSYLNDTTWSICVARNTQLFEWYNLVHRCCKNTQLFQSSMPNSDRIIILFRNIPYNQRLDLLVLWLTNWALLP